MSSASFKVTRYGIIGNLTGSVEGTASHAITASYVSGAVLSPTVQNLVEITSASYSAITNPDPNTLYVITDVQLESASYAFRATSASTADTASIAVVAISSSHATTSDTASYVDGVDSKFLPITGGTVSGSVTIRGGLTVDSNQRGSITYGVGTYATTYSCAGGSGSHAYGTGSHAEGLGTLSSNDYEHAEGVYNAQASSQVFSVGCGDAEATRKNAISVITGSVPLSASIFMYGVAGYDGTNPQPGTNDIATTLAAIVNMIPKVEVIYETDGTTGLLGHNQNSFASNWQLENLDLTPYKKIECYFKAAATSSADSYTPAVVVTIPLDEASMGPTAYFGGVMVALPFNRNREYMVGCAVDSTKTKFQVVHQNTLWDISVSDANNTGRYCYKILGYL